jgi:hypothetical protein
MRFQVLTAASMMMTAFWDIAPCNLFEVYWHFKRAYCLHQQGDYRGPMYVWNLQSTSTSWCYILEGCNFYIKHCYFPLSNIYLRFTLLQDVLTLCYVILRWPFNYSIVNKCSLSLIFYDSLVTKMQLWFHWRWCNSTESWFYYSG